MTTKRSKIKIKYDDGTSELSKFPDRDVVVDAVDNGEHSVPAHQFLPPPLDQITEVDGYGDGDGDETVVMEKEGEGQIPIPPGVVAAATAETEDGEVDEDIKKSEARASHLDSSDSDGIGTTGVFKESVDETTALAKVGTVVGTPTEVPSTPSTGSSSSALSKNEKTNAVGPSSDTHGNKDVQTKPAPSPSQSQEEGELSPGFTVLKSSENASEQQLHQLTQVAVESELLPSKALSESKLGSGKTTTEPIKFAAEKPFANTSKGNAAIPEGENSNVKTVPDLPSKPKKLSIRIPSNSIANMKNMLTPTSNGGAKALILAPSSSNGAAASNMDEILTDTPESKKDITAKRKRVAEDVAPIDVASGQDPPTKRRIKVTIGKALLASASPKIQTNDGFATAKLLPYPRSEEGFVEEELAPIAEEPISAGETKKKKKRGSISKSPLPIQELEKIKSNNNSSETPSASATPKQQKIGSKGSAFSEKKSIVNEEGAITPKQSALKASSSAEISSAFTSLRTGRKAAEDAKEKLTVKQKAKLSAKEPKEKEIALLESGKKKKKRRREKETEEHGEDSDTEQNETEWVQCDDCKKWRVLPDNVKASSLPDLWYCHMNVYDPKRSKCEAPEQNMKQILRERKKRARKRAKREAELAESQQEKATKKIKQQEEETTTATIATITTKKKSNKQDKLLAAGGSTPRCVSPKIAKPAKVSAGKVKESAAESKKANAEAKKATLEGNKKSKVVVEDKPNPSDSGSDTQKEVKKKGKKIKKVKKESLDSSDSQDAADAAEAKKAGRKRGRPARAPTSNTALPTSSAKDNEDEDNVEWVQCDKCEKWRKLPPDISADELPDIWNCSMNTWNPRSASCQAAEDKTDAAHQEVGASEWQLRQAHAGKYSYRQMIFGTGARKHSRPMSERSRAAESLFIQPSTDEEHPHPTTQYTKSSAFLPRVSNFQKTNASEDNTIGIFDVLQHSNLWEELRTMDPNPSKVLSSSAVNINIPGQKFKTYECLSNEIKHAMQDVVLQTLEFGCLTGEEIIGKAQWFPYVTSIKGVAGIRGYCNEDIIIHTLLELVRDGLVEMATVRDIFRPISQWVPRYRRVGTRRAYEAVEAIKASRCMKIAKPWKQRPAESTMKTEWVTGKSFAVSKSF